MGLPTFTYAKGLLSVPQDLSVADPTIVLDLLQAFRRSQVMFAAVKLGVFDALDGRPQSASELAQTLGCDAEALRRMLDALMGLDLLRLSGQVYANTDVASTYLTQASPRRMTGYVNFSGNVTWRLWSHLDDAVREGSHRWKQSYGWDEPIFSNFFQTEEAANEFLMGMHGFGMMSSPAVVHALDLSRFAHLVDLGGATGHLAIAACERYPHLQATVFDLPVAVPLAEKIVGESSVADRVSVVAGDFFTDPLPAGDLYALGRILHDWSEEKSRRLLGRVFESLPPGGGILVAEKILLEDRSGPGWAHMQDLNMLVCAEGRERTLAEYDALLTEAGFSDVTGCRTSTPIDGILAIKPSG